MDGASAGGGADIGNISEARHFNTKSGERAAAGEPNASSVEPAAFEGPIGWWFSTCSTQTSRVGRGLENSGRPRRVISSSGGAVDRCSYGS